MDKPNSSENMASGTHKVMAPVAGVENRAWVP